MPELTDEQKGDLKVTLDSARASMKIIQEYLDLIPRGRVTQYQLEEAAEIDEILGAIADSIEEGDEWKVVVRG